MDHLIKELNQNFNNNVQDMIPIFGKINFNFLKTEVFQDDKTKSYLRTIIHQCDNYELILIKWKPNSESLIHDHASNGCLLKVIDGKLEETLFNQKLELIKETIYHKGEINYIDNFIGYHKIKNLSNNPTYSIHLYSPPNHNTNYF